MISPPLFCTSIRPPTPSPLPLPHPPPPHLLPRPPLPHLLLLLPNVLRTLPQTLPLCSPNRLRPLPHHRWQHRVGAATARSPPPMSLLPLHRTHSSLIAMLRAHNLPYTLPRSSFFDPGFTSFFVVFVFACAVEKLALLHDHLRYVPPRQAAAARAHVHAARSRPRARVRNQRRVRNERCHQRISSESLERRTAGRARKKKKTSTALADPEGHPPTSRLLCAALL
jgi:hypothetical protein